MKAKYAKAETNVNNIVKALESHEVQTYERHCASGQDV